MQESSEKIEKLERQEKLEKLESVAHGSVRKERISKSKSFVVNKSKKHLSFNIV